MILPRKFFVSAKKKSGELVSMTNVSGKGGEYKMKNPFAANDIKTNERIKSTAGVVEISMSLVEKIVLQKK